jgi:urease accessory protein
VLDQGGLAAYQRATGRAEVVLSIRGGSQRLDRLRQSGSAKAILPRVYGSEREVIFLNTAGGLTGGDALGFSVEVGPNAGVVATTQTAERIYDSAGGSARVTVDVKVGRGGRIDWLPQETILFDRSALDRHTRVELCGDGTFLGVEMLVLGRRAMGEDVRQLALNDRREITRDGFPVAVEPLRLRSTHLEPSAVLLRGARAIASLVFVARGAEDAAETIKGIEVDGVEAGVSGWNGRTMLRAFAEDAMPLRQYLVVVLEAIRGRPAPSVWQV